MVKQHIIGVVPRRPLLATCNQGENSKKYVLRMMVTMMVLMVTVVPPLIPTKDCKKEAFWQGSPPTHFVRVNNNSS